MTWRGMFFLCAIALVGASCGGQAPPRAERQPAEGDAASLADQATAMGCEPASTEIRLVALDSETGKPPSYDKECIAVPAGEAFRVRLRSEDFLEHNFSVFNNEDLGELIFRGERFRGPGVTLDYEVPAIEQPGRYTFVCDVHLTQMRGTLFVQ